MLDEKTTAIITLGIIAITAIIVKLDYAIIIATITGIAGLAGYTIGKNSK